MSGRHEKMAVDRLQAALDALDAAYQACMAADFGSVHVLGPLEQVKRDLQEVLRVASDGVLIAAEKRLAGPLATTDTTPAGWSQLLIRGIVIASKYGQAGLSELQEMARRVNAADGVPTCAGCRAEAEFWNEPGRKCVACIAGVSVPGGQVDHSTREGV